MNCCIVPGYRQHSSVNIHRSSCTSFPSPAVSAASSANMLRGIAYSPTLSLARLEVAARRLFVDDQLVVLGVGSGLASNRAYQQIDGIRI